MKKLLKYDLKSIFRIWWIGALATALLSVFGGFCIRILTSDREIPTLILFFAGAALFLLALGIVAFSVLQTVLVFVRFYRNFFTDEGYLTFTLPVKRTDLINSKILSAMITMFAGMFMLFLNIALLLLIGFWEQIDLAAFFDGVVYYFNELWNTLNIYLPIYVLECILAIAALELFGVLLLYCCITFASIMVKKAKVIVAIAVYYFANAFVSYAVQLFTFFGIPGLDQWLSGVWGHYIENPVMIFVLLIVTLLVSLFCALLYALLYWMLDRKLNLS